MDEATWQTEGPAFRQLRDWAETRWNPQEEKAGPERDRRRP
ncbi:MAG: hypothetical protein OXH76_20415 [Boseongicola sp.]|nr:hypothetical protein [Boseongicola sp.]